MASQCVWGTDCESPLPKPDLANLPALPLNVDLSAVRPVLANNRAEAQRYRNPADAPPLARKIAPPGSDDVPFC